MDCIPDMQNLTPTLSTVNSEEYKVWKSETLAKQSCQLEPVQTTGIWHRSQVRNTQHLAFYWLKFSQYELPRETRDPREQDNFVVELAPGYRY